ncbi:GNAT family N-acetyltransferase [Streptomyces sp. NPDC054861]
MDYTIRAIRADEWEKTRAIRLDALRDPAAGIAFLDTYEAAVGRPESFWRERAEGSAEESGGARQFVAEAPDGSWAGTATVLVERPSDETRFGAPAKVDQTHVVGVYVRPEARGTGLTERLFQGCVEWSWGLSEPVVRRVRLYVHQDNARAAAFYRRFGFVATGERVPVPGDASTYECEYEIRRPAARA